MIVRREDQTIPGPDDLAELPGGFGTVIDGVSSRNN
jgi:hypothetical protein